MIDTRPRFRTIHGQVVQELGLEVVSGRVSVGKVLPAEPALCAQLGVSRGALREAVKALAAKGMLEPRPRTGTRVLPREQWNMLDPDVLSWLREADPRALIAHLTEVRSMIEPGAAELAAARASASEAQELLDAYREMERAGADRSSVAFIDADVSFHQLILRISRNPLLAALNSPLEVALHAAFEVTSTASGAVSATLPMHLQVAEAVTDGDGHAAHERMSALISTSADHFEQVRATYPWSS